MQTFLPYPDLRVSCQVLDDRRLGKQRVETFQILRALTWPRYAWKNHPAVRMWRGFVPGLVAYGVENCMEWSRRGYADSVLPQLLTWTGGEEPVDPPLPPWVGLEALHLSHRSALLRKDPSYYRPLFAQLGTGDEPDDLPYLWPPDVFPRWPVRGCDDGLSLDEALLRLGFERPRAGQAEAVAAVAGGRAAPPAARHARPPRLPPPRPDRLEAARSPVAPAPHPATGRRRSRCHPRHPARPRPSSPRGRGTVRGQLKPPRVSF